ncbi:cytochrome P450 [Phlegmacium glaucopus]|nr:cytochrome P450 [Phlegmacium glaucopus]
MDTTDVESGSSIVIFVLLGVFIAYMLLSRTERTEPDLKHIPTIGQSNYLRSYFDALKSLFNGPTVVQKGYEKYHPGIFKIAILDRWIIVVTGTGFIEDIRKAPEDELSFISATNELAHSINYLGQNHPVALNAHEILVTDITRNLPFIVSNIRDEMISAFSDAMDTTDSENSSGWTEFDALELVSQIITRVNNRALVGLPLCRDANFSSGCISMSRDAYHLIPPLPLFGSIVSFVNKITSGSFSRRRRSRKMLVRLIADRQKMNVKHEQEHPPFLKPNDLLSWILQDNANQVSTENIASNLLDICFSTNTMLSLSFTQVLYHIAANHQYVIPMRQEIDSISRRDGWTKDALDKMSKVDSFIKESMRLTSTSTLSMMRKSLRRFTFSDGTVIPPGALIFAAGQARHMDPSIRPTADLFDGFSFSNLEKEQQESARFKLVTTMPDYLVWGYGRHACSGRFFAALMLKLVLAHVVLRYDVKFENDEDARPEDMIVGFNRLPNPHAKVLLRKR